MFAIAAIAPATLAAIEETRMSRFVMCPNSWASTLLTWSGGNWRSNHSVTEGGMPRFASGRERIRLFRRDDVQARRGNACSPARSCTITSSSGMDPGSIGRARLAFSANLSENQ